MSGEEQSQERTEQPSAKRLKEAREKGQIARSKDFNTTVILMFTGVGFLIFGGQLSQHLAQMVQQSLDFDRQILLAPTLAMEKMFLLAKSGLLALAPILIFIFILSLAAPILMGGWVYSGQVLYPQFSRLSPLKGFKRMISIKGLVELVKSLFKFILVAAVALVVLKTQIPQLLGLAHNSVETAIISGGYILIKSFVMIAASLILIATVDVPFQWYEHLKSLKMTKQEMRDEYKETEGKPEVKGAIRRAQQELARRRMMAEVPKANVILTNPTHYAVALNYQAKGSKAPVVVAKGKDLIAFQINKVAQEHKVPIICVPPLARAIYFSTKLNAEIPRGLYVAVAQVLAYIFQLRDLQRYDHKPAVLQNVPIPSDLARDEEKEVIE